MVDSHANVTMVIQEMVLRAPMLTSVTAPIAATQTRNARTPKEATNALVTMDSLEMATLVPISTNVKVKELVMQMQYVPTSTVATHANVIADLLEMASLAQTSTSVTAHIAVMQMQTASTPRAHMIAYAWMATKEMDIHALKNGSIQEWKKVGKHHLIMKVGRLSRMALLSLDLSEAEEWVTTRMVFGTLKRRTTLCLSGEILVKKLIGCINGTATTDGYIVQLELQLTDSTEVAVAKREGSITLNMENAVPVLRKNVWK